ncbi:MAG: hypothetical protein WDO73_33880 [Ignavibacteriota bacterium]
MAAVVRVRRRDLPRSALAAVEGAGGRGGGLFSGSVASVTPVADAVTPTRALLAGGIAGWQLHSAL